MMSKLFYGDIGHEPSLDPPEDDRPPVGTCACCGEVIREGDDYFFLCDEYYCTACVDEARRYG